MQHDESPVRAKLRQALVKKLLGSDFEKIETSILRAVHAEVQVPLCWFCSDAVPHLASLTTERTSFLRDMDRCLPVLPGVRESEREKWREGEERARARARARAKATRTYAYPSAYRWMPLLQAQQLLSLERLTEKDLVSAEMRLNSLKVRMCCMCGASMCVCMYVCVCHNMVNSNNTEHLDRHM